MPLLDVSEVLTDPLFATDILLYRTIQNVGSDGIAKAYRDPLKPIPISGVVTSSDGDVLVREPEGERITGTILVHTGFVLTIGDGRTNADEIVIWGARYIVSNVNDYSQYGAGFVCALCTAKAISPKKDDPTQTNPLNL